MQVTSQLDYLTKVTNFTDFLNNFTNFGGEMAEFAKLTGERQLVGDITLYWSNYCYLASEIIQQR